MTDLKLMQGRCHCGRIALSFSTAIPPEKFSPRACDCSFCQKHGASFISDPNGRLLIDVKESNALGEYRFGHGLAKFLFCRNCAVFVAVLFQSEGLTFASVNSRCMGGIVFGSPQTTSPRELNAEEKKQRWAKIMIPNVEVRVSGA